VSEVARSDERRDDSGGGTLSVHVAQSLAPAEPLVRPSSLPPPPMTSPAPMTSPETGLITKVPIPIERPGSTPSSCGIPFQTSPPQSHMSAWRMRGQSGDSPTCAYPLVADDVIIGVTICKVGVQTGSRVGCTPHTSARCSASSLSTTVAKSTPTQKHVHKRSAQPGSPHKPSTNAPRMAYTSFLLSLHHPPYSRALSGALTTF